MCLLPKAGLQATTSTPLEAKPVVLLPILYRLWAWKMGREVAAWLKAYAMEGLPERIMSLLLERWRRGLTMCCSTALVRCWVDDSTAAGRWVFRGLAVWAEDTRGFEDLEQGGGAKVNRKKSGILVSHRRLQELVEQATAVKVLSPHGCVVGFGPGEPAGWEQRWRSQLGAPAADVPMAELRQ